ncbi:periplasmic heavy metal sensor [uncultured Paludibaculum sp.]|uniref:periplasmic heavy metal sensor n=1 Tax=uncultured Paludibaculum sp. TaxID=1765020 RepID=UPI002AAA98DE|nr:periplasmic heavy metal sensor [uncultured Paludibaculum sp.]
MKRLMLLICLGLPLLAQMPRGFYPWWDSPVAKDLNLTDDQNRQIREIVREYRTKLIDQRASVEKAEVELQDIFGEDNFDQRRGNEAIERLIAARGDMTRSLSQMSLRLRGILTPDQYHELIRRRPGIQPGNLMRELQKRNLNNQRQNGNGGGRQPRPPQQPQQ